MFWTWLFSILLFIGHVRMTFDNCTVAFWEVRYRKWPLKLYFESSTAVWYVAPNNRFLAFFDGHLAPPPLWNLTITEIAIYSYLRTTYSICTYIFPDKGDDSSTNVVAATATAVDDAESPPAAAENPPPPTAGAAASKPPEENGQRLQRKTSRMGREENARAAATPVQRKTSRVQKENRKISFGSVVAEVSEKYFVAKLVKEFLNFWVTRPV